MKGYRDARQRAGTHLIQCLLAAAKNNSALELKRCEAEAWVLFPKSQSAKNTLAQAQVILFELLSEMDEGATLKKNNLLAVAAGTTYK